MSPLAKYKIEATLLSLRSPVWLVCYNLRIHSQYLEQQQQPQRVACLLCSISFKATLHAFIVKKNILKNMSFLWVGLTCNLVAAGHHQLVSIKMLLFCYDIRSFSKRFYLINHLKNSTAAFAITDVFMLSVFFFFSIVAFITNKQITWNVLQCGFKVSFCQMFC